MEILLTYFNSIDHDSTLTTHDKVPFQTPEWSQDVHWEVDLLTNCTGLFSHRGSRPAAMIVRSGVELDEVIEAIQQNHLLGNLGQDVELFERM